MTSYDFWDRLEIYYLFCLVWCKLVRTHPVSFIIGPTRMKILHSTSPRAGTIMLVKQYYRASSVIYTNTFVLIAKSSYYPKRALVQITVDVLFRNSLTCFCSLFQYSRPIWHYKLLFGWNNFAKQRNYYFLNISTTKNWSIGKLQ